MAVTEIDAGFAAPKNYAELYEQYYHYVVTLCAKLGIDDMNKEDVASDILLRFMERGSLEKYDPNLRFEHDGIELCTKFRTYLTRAVIVYTRGHKDRIRKREYREQSASREVSTKPENDNNSIASSYEDTRFRVEDHADEVVEMIYEQAEADGVRRLLAQVPRRNIHDLCDLVALYDAVRVQVLTHGKYDISRLREKFGVSTTAMHAWMWWLRANLADIYGLPMPPRRPRNLHRNPDQP